MTQTPDSPRAALPTDTSLLPPLDPSFMEVLEEGLDALGLTLPPGPRRGITAHARLLLAWNEHINLTALRTPAAVARLHVVDSLSVVPILRDVLPPRRADTAWPRILDLGSGGGYPGLPIALTLPAGSVSFVDSIAKKGAFLEVAATAAMAELEGDAPSPGWEVLVTRAEDLAHGARRGSWHVVTVRAVGTLSEVAELGLPLLESGGLLVYWKRDTGDSGPFGTELDDARAHLDVLGGATPEVHHVRAPGLETHRLVVVRKERPTPRRYPRSPAERRRLLR